MTLDSLVKTNYPVQERELPYFAQHHTSILPTELVETDFDWIPAMLAELMVETEDRLYWIARRGRFERAGNNTVRAVLQGADGEAPISRLLPEDNMWHLMVWTELSDERMNHNMVVTSALMPWITDHDSRFEMVRQSVNAILRQLDAMDATWDEVGTQRLRGRIRRREE